MGETGPGPREETVGPTAVRVVRPRRSPPAVVAAASAAAVSVLALAVITASLGGLPAPLPAVDGMAAHAATTPWEAPEAMLASAVTAALGLTLLITASLPGYGGRMAPWTDDRDTVADRRAPRDLRAVPARGGGEDPA